MMRVQPRGGRVDSMGKWCTLLSIFCAYFFSGGKIFQGADAGGSFIYQTRAAYTRRGGGKARRKKLCLYFSPRTFSHPLTRGRLVADNYREEFNQWNWSW
ncbi:hypothetical protein BDV38DRAFT_3335 [Aspergillus pseudotamarii]|uniref:Uncharacterized protein n=1 Tax=Aspergillus pseudotamarii TaxID=132259 RepID=A0A5N6TBZ1_ASPPS|nr:uncharacterized protein BDV38DRAFT_3335 [Aspergillus pseudotamarii]KAE8143787.1 hypothetical protein BDV38DRAFT_3335 [Aspergillus pseudotamarii]